MPVRGIPEVRRGDDVAKLILQALRSGAGPLRDGDIIVVKQKIVSKAEGNLVKLGDIEPRRRARLIAKKENKEPELVELMLRESRRIVRMGHGVIVTETRHGFVCANAGIDRSNVQSGYVALLPDDPDKSARTIMRSLEVDTGKKLAVIVTDTFGRPWRKGQTDVAIGSAGIEPLRSYKGRVDAYGYTLRVTEPAVVDEVAGAAELVMGKLSSIPVALVRGAKYKRSERGIKSIVMPPERDLFR